MLGFKKWLSMMIIFFLMLHVLPYQAIAEEEKRTDEQIRQERMSLYLKYEAITLVPWYYLAAVDQYERNIQRVRKDIPAPKGDISIYFPSSFWGGTLNPNEHDKYPESITFFNGNGLDGNGDGFADREEDEDALYTMANYLAQYGASSDDFKIGLWEYYKNDITVKQIMSIAKIYAHFQTLELDNRAFPLPLFHSRSYRSTWGDRRGWGGRRIHEGTDIFASYGVPVRSTTYGVVEIMGWNRYGGWRVGIRDIHNVYHYFAHLSGFNDEVKVGDVVEPGTVVGYVGSSGYGKPGTSGKFPPHLHYGMYKFNGRTEWAFDPYPYLRRWEKQERRRRNS